MPIEIRELNIRIHVNENQQEQDPAAGQSGNSSSAGTADKDELIADCIEKIMELLKNKQER